MKFALQLLLVTLLALPCEVNAQTCSASASPVSFGSVSPIARTAVTATGTVNVTCTWPATATDSYVKVCLNIGGTSPRFLVNGSAAMQYDLYQDAAHSVAWGSVYYGTPPISLTLARPAGGTHLTQTVTVYGQLASNQPTIPTVGNSSTVYAQTFGGNTTSVNYAFYQFAAPPCSSITGSAGTFPFTASATVINDCYINATNISFTSVGALGTSLNANGSITAQCTSGDAWRIALNGGSSGSVGGRTMQRSGGGGTVNYQLYSDASHTVAWGDGTASTTAASGVGTGYQQIINVYGVVPPQTTPAPGTYSDTITATISF
ncbi:spore coat U domain-containing protein (plasmid) [Paraburkholderia sp. PREW-6R]|uniref:Csu type fimbrial protein n=1 Tax=Paraburkholderia sp. PREW-6R TaxID=3141544 RepID=UPI0031F4D621